MLGPMSRVALLFALAACTDREAAQLEDVKAKVCACKTSACAEAAMGNVPKEHVTSNHRTQAVAQQMLDCLSKLYDKEKPSTNPDDVTDPPPVPAAAAAAPPTSAPPAKK